MFFVEGSVTIQYVFPPHPIRSDKPNTNPISLFIFLSSFLFFFRIHMKDLVSDPQTSEIPLPVYKTPIPSNKLKTIIDWEKLRNIFPSSF